MRYYIGRVNTWKAQNNKCEELNREIKTYENTLVADELSREALMEQVRQTVERLNAAYPRTRKLVVVTRQGSVICHPEQRVSDSDAVFSFELMPVRRSYRFAEGSRPAITEGCAGSLTEGGEYGRA